MRRFFILSAVSLALGCKPRIEKTASELQSASSSVGVLNASGLSVSDVSILVPLSRLPSHDPLLKTQGTGFCNAPRLENPAFKSRFLSRKLFSRFSKRVFSGEGPTCPYPAVSTIPQQQLIDSGRHVAMYKGLPRSICTYDNWRVVGIRFDICANRSDFSSPPSNADFKSSRCIKEARLIAQPFLKSSRGDWVVVDAAMHLLYDIPDPDLFLRDIKTFAKLSRQRTKAETHSLLNKNPLELTPHPGLVSEMGLCQNDHQPTPLGQQLNHFLAKNFKQSQMQGIAWMTSDLAPGVWTFANQGVDGKSETLEVDIISQKRRDFSAEVAAKKVPALVSERIGNKIWPEQLGEQIRSGEVSKQNVSKMMDEVIGRDQRIDEDCADNFSNESLQRGLFPLRPVLLQRGAKTPCGPVPRVNISRWFDHKGVVKNGFSFAHYRQDPLIGTIVSMKAGEESHNLRQKIIKKYLGPLTVLDHLSRPDKISQLGQRSSNCTSCHLLDQALNSVFFSLNAPRVPSLGEFLGQPPIWQGFRKKGQQKTNLRNFGYGPGFSFGVSVRTLQESVEVRRHLQQWFGP